MYYWTLLKPHLKKIIPILTLVLTAFLIYLWTRGPDIPPQEAIEKALDLAKRSESYKFKAETRTKINGKDHLDSKINGERAGIKKVHLKGTIVDSPVEFYQLGDTIYVKDYFTEKWLVFRGNKLRQGEIWITEFNPLSYLNFKNLGIVKYLEDGEVEGDNCHIYSVRPNVGHPYLEMMWKDFEYFIWVTKGDYHLRKVKIKAVGKVNKKDKIDINLEFYDYDKPVEIKAPQV